MTTTAHLLSGKTIEIADRIYIARPDGETVLTGARTAEGHFLAARDIAYFG